MTEEFVQIRNLHRTFQEGELGHPVLQGTSLTLNRGETVALLGRSGSGKSTLLNVISGIDKADAGTVIVDGIDLTALSEHECTLFRRQHIGFVYQFFNLIPTLTAAENIALVLELNGYSPVVIKEKTDRMIQAVDLAKEKDKFPDQMSGCQQPRVPIASSFGNSPQLVLADEPTGNLDAEIGQQILKLLRELITGKQGTLMLVTHSLAVARTADRIITLEDGLLVEREGHFAW